MANDTAKFENIELFEVLGYIIYRNISKTAQNGHILYNIKEDREIFNLNLFDLYDYLRNSEPKKLTLSLKSFFELIFKDQLDEEKQENIELENKRLLLHEDLKKEVITKKEVELKLRSIENKQKNQKLSKIAEKLDSAINVFKTENEFKNFLVSFHEPIYNLFKEFMSYYKIIVDDTNYMPIHERIYMENGRKLLNLYKMPKGFKDLKPNSKAKFPHIERLTKNICGSEKRYIYFMNFLAYKIQNPLDVPPCHIIIQDDGGTGKSDLLLGDVLEKIFKVNPITQTELTSDFNSYMVGSSLIWCEEVEGFDDEKKLKALTGAKWISLNEKHEKNKKVKNYNNFIVASNELRVMKITEKDRRWSVIGGGKRLVPLTPDNWKETIFKDEKENEDFFKGYHKNLKTELNEIYSYLLSLKVTRNMVQIPLQNDLKNQLINMNKTSEISFVDDIFETNINHVMFETYGSNAPKFFERLIINKTGECGGNWIKLSGLFEFYIQYCLTNQYTKKLSKKIFLKRLQAYKLFNEVFNEYKVIWDNDTNSSYKCLKITNPKHQDFQNEELEEIKI